MQEGSGVTNLQTELNYLDLFKSYCNTSDLGFLDSGGGVGQVGGGGVSRVINYTGFPLRLENLEKWEGIFQSGKSQGILNRLEKSGKSQGKSHKILEN